MNLHAPGNQGVPSAFRKVLIMGTFVENGTIRGAVVFRPLVFDVDKRPLPPAKFEVLQAGKLEVILLLIHLRSLQRPVRPAFPP